MDQLEFPATFLEDVAARVTLLQTSAMLVKKDFITSLLAKVLISKTLSIFMPLL